MRNNDRTAHRVTEQRCFGPGLDWHELPKLGKRPRRNLLAFLANPWLWLPLVSALFWLLVWQFVLALLG